MILTQVIAARKLFFAEASQSGDVAALERAFFRSLCLPNGTHKTTAPGRLVEMDIALSKILPSRENLRVLDVGISSGATTLELLDTLEQMGHTVSGIGVDLRVWSFLRSFLGIDILYDQDGMILQIATPLFARGRPGAYPATLRGRALESAISLLESLVVRHWLPRPSESLPLALVSPRLMSRHGFAVVEHDLSKPRDEWIRSFRIVRAANLLNRSYFPTSQLSIMVNNLASWLAVDGFLVVCRTSDSDQRNHGSIFTLDGSSNRLRLVQRVGDGSEIESIIQNVLLAEGTPA